MAAGLAVAVGLAVSQEMTVAAGLAVSQAATELAATELAVAVAVAVAVVVGLVRCLIFSTAAESRRRRVWQVGVTVLMRHG